ncbi:MAG: aminodeoxychorismate synthase component I [Melioribacteraceae bacterium]|nr:aminodeoxychorismate synthase component I [Melioribacteraceae bacterium]
MNLLGKKKIPFLFVIDFEMENSFVFQLSELTNENIFFCINEPIKEKIDKNFFFKKSPVNFETYKKAFEYVKEEIKKGNSYLTNLTFQTEIETNLTLEEIYEFSNAKYKLLFKDQFVVFSPECFVKIENGIISSYPMKGTIDAKIPNAKEIILKDEKEFAEHVTIVDLIRNDLSIVAKNVHVENFRYVEKIVTNEKELYQVSSKIVGELPHNYNEIIGDIIFSMLPAGSISGAPKKKTVEIIKKAENCKRGFYTGIFGLFDGFNLDSAVMIRFIENNNGNLFYRSGGGITYLSDVNLEYQELIDKVYVPIV